MRPQIQAAEMGFLCRVVELSLRNGVKISVIQEKLRVELLFLIERSQLKWFGHVIWIPHGRLHLEVFQARPLVGGPREDPESTGGVVYILWPGNALRFPRMS